ncbi:Rib/alpha-like domain-containing protein [Corynebacterium mastitidis]|uniref:Rib/alpha-like domain-containing protein n=1 Tax=Corynebacterium mastitidis TaxID=161890 RepID=UPI003CC7CEFA
MPTASAVPSAAPVAGLGRGGVCEGGTFKVTSAPAYVKQNDNGTLTIDTSQAKAGESFTLKGVYTEPTSSRSSQVAEPSAVRENHSARGSSGSSGSSGASAPSASPSAQAGPDSEAVAGQGCSGRSVPVALDVSVGEAPAGQTAAPAGASQAAGAPGTAAGVRNEVSYPPVRVSQGGSATVKPEGEIAPYNATRAANTYPWVSVATDGTVTASPGRDVTPGTYKVPVALTDTAGNVVSMAEVAVEVTGESSKGDRPAADGDAGASGEVTAAQPSMTVTENQRVIDPNEQEGPAGSEAAESSAVAAPRPGGNGGAASQGSGASGGTKSTPAGGKASTVRSNQSLPVTGSPIRLLAGGGMLVGLAAVVLVLWAGRKRHET